MIIVLPDYIEDPIRGKLDKVKTTVIKNLPGDELPDEVFVSTSSSQGSLELPRRLAVYPEISGRDPQSTQSSSNPVRDSAL